MERQPTRKIELNKQSPFVVFCQDEKKILYEPDEDNMVTRNIGEQAAISHSGSFDPPHNVLVISFGKKDIQ